MLSNAYFLAKFRFDTAENDPAKNLQEQLQNLPIKHFDNFAKPSAAGTTARWPSCAARKSAVAPHSIVWSTWARRRSLGGGGQLAGDSKRTEGVSKIGKISNFCKFWRARSRLYQNEFLQENMRLTAFLKLYKICILLYRCNLKILAKTRFEKSAIFLKIQPNVCKCCKICKIC